MQLAECNGRPMGVGSHQGLKAGVIVNTNSGCSTQGHRSQENSPDLRRSAKITSQGGNKGSLSLSQPVPQQDLCGSEEGRFTKASDKPKATEPIYEEHSLQDGESEHDEGFTEAGQLDGFNRPQGCIPLSGSMGRPSQVPPLYVAGHHI